MTEGDEDFSLGLIVSEVSVKLVRKAVRKAVLDLGLGTHTYNPSTWDT